MTRYHQAPRPSPQCLAERLLSKKVQAVARFIEDLKKRLAVLGVLFFRLGFCCNLDSNRFHQAGHKRGDG